MGGACVSLYTPLTIFSEKWILEALGCELEEVDKAVWCCWVEFLVKSKTFNADPADIEVDTLHNVFCWPPPFTGSDCDRQDFVGSFAQVTGYGLRGEVHGWSFGVGG